MWFGNIFADLEALRNPERAIPMAAYMRNQFPFLGVAAAPRKNATKTYFAFARKNKIIDFDFVEVCFQKEEREFHLIGVDYLLTIQDILTPDHLDLIKKYILTKSWWDTVDGLDGVIGKMTLQFPEVKNTMLEWSGADNFWLRRVAIDHQLLFKTKTDEELLAEIIINNLGQTEFFINKAIGWALRDYSKTNPEWVRTFIEEHHKKMAPLSIREGKKYLSIPIKIDGQ